MSRVLRPSRRNACLCGRQNRMLGASNHAKLQDASGLQSLVDPLKPAVVVDATGEIVTYRDLEKRSNRFAHLFRRAGLEIGDAVAVLLDNVPVYFDVAWAAHRAGLYLVCVSARLTAPEIAYVVADSGAKLLITSERFAKRASHDKAIGVPLTLVDDDPSAGLPTTPIDDERAGLHMLYSSGTTGRPKGIKSPLPDERDFRASTVIEQLGRDRLGMDSDTVYLGPAPLYHAAPLRWSLAVHRLGGTIILMDKFDAEGALATIERHGVTHSQWVPTHFVRMLKLPDSVRRRYDHSTLRLALHAAAPCPISVKRQMIDWWGPILLEYYAGTEGNGMTMIESAEWQRHPGSVGRAVMGRLEVCSINGERLPTGEDGLIFFADGPGFAYHNDAEKTAEAYNERGWSTLGDIGHLDDEGFLYLTDRKRFTIISGGVNIYPQEIENVLVDHPAVADAAVVGAPDPEMGERVVAIVQPLRWEDAGPALAEELTVMMRASLSGIKIPRRIDFERELPREPNGKLLKRLLRDRLQAEAERADAT